MNRRGRASCLQGLSRQRQRAVPGAGEDSHDVSVGQADCDDRFQRIRPLHAQAATVLDHLRAQSDALGLASSAGACQQRQSKHAQLAAETHLDGHLALALRAATATQEDAAKASLAQLQQQVQVRPGALVLLLGPCCPCRPCIRARRNKAAACWRLRQLLAQAAPANDAEAAGDGMRAEVLAARSRPGNGL